MTRTLKLVDLLLEHADDMAMTCEDDDCLVLEGVIRDSAHKLRRAAQGLGDELTTRAQNQK